METLDDAAVKADPARYAGPMGGGSPEISIIVPARDEEKNIRPLLEELDSVLSAAALAWEVIVVDDASRDLTLDRLRDAQRRFTALKVLVIRKHGGQSAALAAGIAAARGTLIGMMDADLQNCPADFLPMLRMLREDPAASMIQGLRVRRRDSWAKRQASLLGYWTRRIVLGDRVRDAGCTLRLLRRACATGLPLHYKGLHRFIPFLAALNGGKVLEIPVDHRPRHSGRSKYHIGLLSRGACGFLDLLAVRWMAWRRCPVIAEVVSGPAGGP